MLLRELFEGDDSGNYRATAREAMMASKKAKTGLGHEAAARLHHKAAAQALSDGQNSSVVNDHQLSASEHTRLATNMSLVGGVKAAEDALARHADYKIEHEKKYGPMSAADLHQHEAIRKQLMAKKLKAQSASNKRA